MTNSIGGAVRRGPGGPAKPRPALSGKPSALTDGAKAMLGAARWLETESLDGAEQ